MTRLSGLHPTQPQAAPSCGHRGLESPGEAARGLGRTPTSRQASVGSTDTAEHDSLVFKKVFVLESLER